MEYDKADWLQRAEMFLNDGRSRLGSAQSMFSQAASMANSPIPRQKDIDNLLAMSQSMATLANGFLTGAMVCIGMWENGADDGNPVINSDEQAPEETANKIDEEVLIFPTQSPTA